MMNTLTGQSITVSLAYAAVVALSVGCALHALMNKRESPAAIGWIALCLLAPITGPVIYVVFGINRIPDSNEGGLIPPRAAPLPGNCVSADTNCMTSLESMLAAIAGAKNSVLLSQYIFESHGIGRRFIDALTDAQNRGATVYVILDRVGALYSFGSTYRALQHTGINVAVFSPLRLWNFPPRLNLRNHRKLMVVDGRCAFVSGMNIRNGYLKQRRRASPTMRDTQFEFSGPIVKDIVALFYSDWYRCTKQHVAIPLATPEATGAADCRVTDDGPDNCVDFITLALIAAIHRARSRVCIVSPYFLPPREITAALQVAAQNGVCVDIVVPEKNNLFYVHWAMQHHYRELLPYGIRIYQQRGSFDHSKLVTIDNECCIVGSVNVDARSLRLNFEVALEVFDPALATTMTDHIDQLIRSAVRVDSQNIRALPLWQRFRNACAWLGSPYL